MDGSLKTILFKARCSEQIGFGHVSRCLALAAKLPGDWRPLLVLNDHPRGLERAAAAGVEAIAEPDLAVLRHRRVDAVVYDSFQDDDAFFQTVRKVFPGKIVGLDYQNYATPRVDVILTLFSHQPKPADGKTDIREGLEYAIIGEQFRPFRLVPPPTPEKIGRVLVLMGGADPEALTPRAVEFLSKLDDPPRVDVILGPLNPHLEAVKKLAWAGVSIHQNTPRLPELMAGVDAAISGCGTSFFELSFLGRPALVMAQNAMERRFAAHLEASGLTFLAETLSDRWADFAAKDMRRSLVEKQTATFDGNGAAKILAAAGI